MVFVSFRIVTGPSLAVVFPRLEDCLIPIGFSVVEAKHKAWHERLFVADRQSILMIDSSGNPILLHPYTWIPVRILQQGLFDCPYEPFKLSTAAVLQGTAGFLPYHVISLYDDAARHELLKRKT